MRTVPWSPRLGQYVPLSRNAKGRNLFNVLNSQESGLKVNQPASFAIRLNGAKGKIDAKVHSPSGAVEECHVSELEPGKPEVGCEVRTGVSARDGSDAPQPQRRAQEPHRGQRPSRPLLLSLPGSVYSQGINISRDRETLWELVCLFSLF